MKYLTLFLIQIFSQICLAEDLPNFSPALQTPSLKFTFANQSKKAKDLGTLTLTNEKKNIKLEFEGTTLSKGHYRIVISEKCQLAKGKNKVSVLNELYKFETHYGEVSSEEHLTYEKIEDLNLQDKVVVLLKKSKSGEQIISCSTQSKGLDYSGL